MIFGKSTKGRATAGLRGGTESVGVATPSRCSQAERRLTHALLGVGVGKHLLETPADSRYLLHSAPFLPQTERKGACSVVEGFFLGCFHRKLVCVGLQFRVGTPGL